MDTIELVCAPSFIDATSAEHMYHVVISRLPVDIAKLEAKCTNNIFVLLSSDSAKPCLRLARHLGALAAICRTHQHSMAVVQPLKVSGLMSAIFCAALLTRRQKTQKVFKRELERWAKNNVKVSFAKLPLEGTKHAASVLEMLEATLVSGLVDDTSEPHRLCQLRKLKKFLGSIRGPHIYHYCPIGWGGSAAWGAG